MLTLQNQPQYTAELVVRATHATKLGITFVNKFSNLGTKIEFVCSHWIKVCLFLPSGAEAAIKGSRKQLPARGGFWL
jgi:hypothetical protein